MVRQLADAPAIVQAVREQLGLREPTGAPAQQSEPA
jgi:hypothetical protein